MPLQTQTITIPFVKGVETKLDPKLVDDGSLLELENASFAEDGTPDRRNALVELEGSDLSHAPSHVTTYGNQLLSVAGKTLYSYSPGTDSQTARGTVSPCQMAK